MPPIKAQTEIKHDGPFTRPQFHHPIYPILFSGKRASNIWLSHHACHSWSQPSLTNIPDSEDPRSHLRPGVGQWMTDGSAGRGGLPSHTSNGKRRPESSNQGELSRSGIIPAAAQICHPFRNGPVRFVHRSKPVTTLILFCLSPSKEQHVITQHASFHSGAVALLQPA